MDSLGYKVSLPHKKKKEGITHYLRLSTEERIHWPGVHFQDSPHEVAATGAPGDRHHHAENDHLQHGGGHEQTPQGRDP